MIFSNLTPRWDRDEIGKMEQDANNLGYTTYFVDFRQPDVECQSRNVCMLIIRNGNNPPSYDKKLDNRLKYIVYFEWILNSKRVGHKIKVKIHENDHYVLGNDVHTDTTSINNSTIPVLKVYTVLSAFL